jgi:A/G-specific adenine glycosylase
MAQLTGKKKTWIRNQDLILQEQLLAWFAAHGRDLPWRRTYLPYHIWISEIMLQQTRMDRVLTCFGPWLRRFPDLTALAAAEEEEVLKHWEGLGYSSRARNLLLAARIVVAEGNGELPADHRQLLKLPGIGPYTAGALMSLAFNQDYAAVDTNVERILARMCNLDSPVREQQNQLFIRQRARELLPAGKARWFNQALMELGALICRPGTPECPQCPVADHCESRRLGITGQRPVPGRSREVVPILMASGVLVRQGRVFIQKRPSQGVWAGLWEFPGGRIEPGESPAEALRREFREETEFQVSRIEKIAVIRHNYTRYRVTLHCFFCRLASATEQPVLHAAQASRWATRQEIARLAFPAAHRRLISLMECNRSQPGNPWGELSDE